MSNLLQEPEVKEYLSLWASRLGWASILTSIIAPPLGFIIGLYSLSFARRRRDRYDVFPYVALVGSVVMLGIHISLWARLLS